MRRTTRCGRGVEADAARYLSPSGAGFAAIVVGWLATVALLLCAGFYHFGTFDPPLWLLVPAFVLSFGLIVMACDPAVRTVRTADGRDLWTRAGGFGRFLTTDSSESRFDAADAPRLVSALPGLGSGARGRGPLGPPLRGPGGRAPGHPVDLLVRLRAVPRQLDVDLVRLGHQLRHDGVRRVPGLVGCRRRFRWRRVLGRLGRRRWRWRFVVGTDPDQEVSQWPS